MVARCWCIACEVIRFARRQGRDRSRSRSLYFSLRTKFAYHSLDTVRSLSYYRCLWPPGGGFRAPIPVRLASPRSVCVFSSLQIKRTGGARVAARLVPPLRSRYARVCAFTLVCLRSRERVCVHASVYAFTRVCARA